VSVALPWLKAGVAQHPVLPGVLTTTGHVCDLLWRSGRALRVAETKSLAHSSADGARRFHTIRHACHHAATRVTSAFAKATPALALAHGVAWLQTAQCYSAELEAAQQHGSDSVGTLPSARAVPTIVASFGKALRNAAKCVAACGKLGVGQSKKKKAVAVAGRKPGKQHSWDVLAQEWLTKTTKEARQIMGMATRSSLLGEDSGTHLAAVYV